MLYAKIIVHAVVTAKQHRVYLITVSIVQYIINYDYVYNMFSFICILYVNLHYVYCRANIYKIFTYVIPTIYRLIANYY